MKVYIPYTRKRLERELAIRGYNLVMKKTKGPLNIPVREYIAQSESDVIRLSTVIEKAKPDWKMMAEQVNRHTRTVPVETLLLC